MLKRAVALNQKLLAKTLKTPAYSLLEILSILKNILIEKWRKDLDNNFVAEAVLTDLSKAFDCIPHDLLIAKLSAYNFSDEALFDIYHTWQIEGSMSV